MPLVEQAFSGEPIHMDDITLMMDREGLDPEAHFAFSYTPVRDEGDTVRGFFCACTETTDVVMANRRQAFRLELEDALRGVESAKAIMDVAVAALGRHLGVSRAGYAEVQPDAETVVLASSYAEGVKRLQGSYRLDGFGNANAARQRRGTTTVIRDVLLGPRLRRRNFRSNRDASLRVRPGHAGRPFDRNALCQPSSAAALDGGGRRIGRGRRDPRRRRRATRARRARS